MKEHHLSVFHPGGGQCPRSLPIVQIDRERFFVDRRLRELRHVAKPWESLPLSEIEMGLILAAVETEKNGQLHPTLGNIRLYDPESGDTIAFVSAGKKPT